MNKVFLSGHLGRDAELRRTQAGKPVANLSVATAAGYRDKATGKWVDRVAWHKVVTFQEGLVSLVEKHGSKGRFIEVVGTLDYQNWRRSGESTDRTTTRILVDWNGELRFPVPERVPTEMEEVLDSINEELYGGQRDGDAGEAP